MAATLALEASDFGRAGSSPVLGTIFPVVVEWSKAVDCKSIFRVFESHLQVHVKCNMNFASKRKSDFLGINFSTAGGILKKRIMFMLVQKTGMDNCFKCKKKIETVEELSVEHKEPWYQISVEKFWDLENIAFSHRICNLPHRHQGKNQRLSPSGYGYCYICEKFILVDQMTSYVSPYTKKKNTGSYCYSCHNKRQNEKRARNRIVV